jgi:KUP system potassium uptake protein
LTEVSTTSKPEGRYLAALSLAALGVVYGDIGTSPLYAFRESFHESYGIAASAENVLGVLSLIFWSLIVVISVKYLVFVMQADNQGEGGIMALTALVAPRRSRSRRRNLLVLLGLFGAALLYGDSVITPAISVLSAVEGLEVATPFFRPYIIPITIGILLALFAIQRRGTSGIGKVFGPVTLVWFVVLAVLGLVSIFREPHVMAALNPIRGIDFFVRNGGSGFFVLGSVFLVVTGGEALYADMGHFGVLPIRLTWFVVVLPSLLLNYFGQGALILNNPAAVENPFFRMAPEWALYPIVALATAATVIASQAVISGAFSLTRQAVRLGYLPRMGILHTSTKEVGQIYIPAVNWTLMIGCIGLVIGFQTSSNLAAAYGVGVTTDMVFTTILFAVVARSVWKWSLPAAAGLAALFLVADLSFWGANLPKIPDGGWFPLVVAGIIFGLMTTWKKGRDILSQRLSQQRLPLEDFIQDVEKREISRVPGTAVFMYGSPHGTPPALLHNLKHNKVLHQQVVVVRVDIEEVPRIPESKRVELETLKSGFYRLTVRYGFAQDPNIPEVLSSVKTDGLRFEPMETTYFLGRERILATPIPGMAIWRERLFALMARNARSATSYFQIPPNRVVELGSQVEM